MYPNIKLGSGNLYVSDGEDYKEIGTITGGYNIVTEELAAATSGYIDLEDLEEAAVALSKQFQNVQTTLSIRPTYKKWFKKKKGKRYVYRYIVKEGFDPKVIKMLIGGE